VKVNKAEEIAQGGQRGFGAATAAPAAGASAAAPSAAPRRGFGGLTS
jgi:hypothetical protein